MTGQSTRSSAARRALHAATRLASLAVAAGVGAALVWNLTDATPARSNDPFLRRTPTVRAVEQVGPSVVNITTEHIVQQRPFRGRFSRDPSFDRFFGDFFEPRLRPGRSRKVQNLGSGVIIDADRHVLTNEHVVARASRIRVTLADGREFEAKLVGADSNNDVAVLEIDTDEELPWTAPGTSSDLLVGEPVIAIGNPFGFSNTVTTGVISALNRSLRTSDHTYHGFLQTDASINPGNSGGPLLNAEGALVGINTAVYQDAQGIGFAIPIDVAERVVQQLIRFGEVQPVWLGLDFQDLDPALHEVLELPDGETGVLVNSVQKDSPAERGGVLRGDILTRTEGRPLNSAVDFFEMLEPVTAGQRLQVDLWRDGERLTLELVAEEISPDVLDELAERTLGMRLKARRGGGFDVEGVLRNSHAGRIGVERGDILLAIDGVPLEDRAMLHRAILKLRGRGLALVVVQRGAGRYHVRLPLR